MKIIKLLTCVCVLFLAACTTGENKETTITPENTAETTINQKVEATTEELSSEAKAAIDSLETKAEEVENVIEGLLKGI